MNKKGFAISVILYSMVILVIGIMFLLLGIIRNRYNISDRLKQDVINYLNEKDNTGDKTLVSTIETTLSSNLTELDTDGTRYITGEIVTNNYLWYSGKLWRIVAINEDNTVKLITEENMTTLSWYINGSEKYSTSQMRLWLKNEFLSSLSNHETLVANSKWDYTTYSSFPTEKLSPTSTVTDKVGLLTIYDYYMTGGTGDTTTSKTYLNNGNDWWTIVPKSDSNTWYVTSDGKANSGSSTNTYGARPSINLVSDIIIDGGDGTKTNPYRIKGDKTTGQANELLNNRVSGEYINFNNNLYRIVGIENGLTKITMVNDNNIGNVAFGNSVVFSETTGIGLYLNNWYNNDISSTYKSMIANKTNGVLWYQGPTSGTGYDYTKSKTGTGINTTVGLPYYGEMFSTKSNSDDANTWLMTLNNSSSIWHINNTGGAGNSSSTSKNNVRPSMYLQSGVRIVSGSGLPDDAYKLTRDTIVVGYITYNVNGPNVTAPSKQEILSDGSTIINAALANTEDYKFLGWATSANGKVVYQKGDLISVNSDITLYAKWQTLNNYLLKASSSNTAFWPASIEAKKSNITEVRFINMERSEINKKINSATIKEDVSDTSKGGVVKAWLETDSNDSSKYIMYVASEGKTYFPYNSIYMFGSFSSLKTVVFDNVKTSTANSMFYMFYNCSSLTTLDLSSFDISNVALMYCMFKGCSNLESVNLDGWYSTKVEQIQEIFSGCSKLTSVDLSGISSSNVKESHSMFLNCTSLTSVNLSNFQVSTTSNVNMYRAFNGCSKLMTIDIRKINFSKVTGFYNMFYGVPDNSKIIVMDETQKTWILNKFNTLNNIQVAS